MRRQWKWGLLVVALAPLAVVFGYLFYLSLPTETIIEVHNRTGRPIQRLTVAIGDYREEAPTVAVGGKAVFRFHTSAEDTYRFYREQNGQLVPVGECGYIDAHRKSVHFKIEFSGVVTDQDCTEDGENGRGR